MYTFTLYFPSHFMRRALLINTILCVLGTAGASFVTVASIVSIAYMYVPWVSALVAGAFLLPLTFLLSATFPWMTNRWGSKRATLSLMALPWFYTVLFVASMFVSFPV